MSSHHQAPSFPVSSSPILPHDVQSIRLTRPSPSSPFSLSDDPQSFSTSSGGLTTGNPHEFAPHPARPVPSDWTGNDATVRLDSSTLGSQYRQTINDSTGMASNTPYLPSCSLASTPSGWDGPMNMAPHPMFPQGSDGATTFFYRSPTPSSRQRTNQACEKCRDRKTKCSGGRPTCSRCQTRGLVCEYATQHRVRGPTRTRRRNIPPVTINPPTSAPPTRVLFVPHPYASPAPTNHPRWESQSISLKGRGLEANVAARTAWSLSDHSDESSDSSGAASFELSERTRYLGWSNAQTVDYISQPPRQGPNLIQHSNSRFHAMHRSTANLKNQICSPTVNPAPSMPQLTSHGTSPASSYPAPTALDTSFMEFLSPSQERLRRCPSSSSSSRESHSHSSAGEGQGPLASGVSSDTVMLANWLSAASSAEDRCDLWREYSSPTIASAADAEGETPRYSSQTFNVSEWITGTDYCSSPVHASPATETVTSES